MDDSILNGYAVYSETKFRTPLSIERQIGLWVDRIGDNLAQKRPEINRLRKLGQYAAVYIEKGSGFFISPTAGRIDLNQGDVVILFPDEPHAYSPAPHWHEKFIIWNGPDAVGFEKLGFLDKKQTLIKDPAGIVGLAHDKLKAIIAEEDKAAILQRKNIIMQMVLDLFRMSNPRDKADPVRLKIQAAVAWLTQHYARDISISDVAQQYNFSESHFRKYFKQYTGRSPREFINSLRISKAKELLQQGYSIKQVAAAVGCQDMFYFMRLFKKATQVSCSTFRNQ